MALRIVVESARLPEPQKACVSQARCIAEHSLVLLAHESAAEKRDVSKHRATSEQ
jgi:hypothetical protein